jgi:hypothetical protein
MTTSPRSSIIMPGDTVRLRVLFRGSDGQPADLDAFPAITIVEPSGGVVAGPTSAGVFREAVGTYGFDFDVGLMPALGVWRDLWQGTLNGFAVVSEFTFMVGTTEMPAINTDGYVHLGDDPGFSYSQNAIMNINELLKLLRARLNSRGKHADLDEFGNRIYTDCDIFNIDQLVSFLVMALSEFNETPAFTYFTFDDTPIIKEFAGILVQGATLVALSSQALIERGREFQITDNGIGFTPPTISELMNTQWSTELSNWYDRVKLIKFNMKPNPLGLGTLRPLAAAPQFLRLRHLRARRIIGA